MHNMIIEDERNVNADIENWREAPIPEVETVVDETTRFQQFLAQHRQIKDKEAHLALRNVLIEHLWEQYNPTPTYHLLCSFTFLCTSSHFLFFFFGTGIFIYFFFFSLFSNPCPELWSLTIKQFIIIFWSFGDIPILFFYTKRPLACKIYIYIYDFMWFDN
ncbi:hypothetical protein ACOSQ4_026340 [Xanthoceras sorbifolium]